MNKKSLITIIFAIVLALLCAYFIVIKDNSIEEKALNEQQELVQENVIEEINKEEFNNVVADENIQQNIKQANKEEFIVNEKKDNENDAILNEQSSINNVVQEASIIEEVPDYGIMKDENGNIIITRAFSPKSRYKYSFRDFGVIDKVSSK